MPDHLIRLRGPWELRFSADSPSDARHATRIGLPADAIPEDPLPITLSRRFGRPIRVSRTQPCRLRCASVPGLLAIRLNGDPLFERPPEAALATDPIELAIPGALRDRNLIEFTVLGLAARLASPNTPWGSVVLVFPETDESPSC
ncbi:hypothetical protein AB1L88_08335 [Tautonia sp. JC769]|uniref:hypothetical protein n=1 Tax=Tautonia sp. JC769 TaxID=3232135 RepID=UPI00345AEC69